MKGRTEGEKSKKELRTREQKEKEKKVVKIKRKGENTAEIEACISRQLFLQHE